jgi:hypothetical protein
VRILFIAKQMSLTEQAWSLSAFRCGQQKLDKQLGLMIISRTGFAALHLAKYQ